MHIHRRSISVGLCLTSVLLCPSSSRGETPRAKEIRACASSYERAQELRQKSKLRRAKEALAACAKPTCGDFVRRECTIWLAQVETETPSLVLLAKDDAGRALLDVEVTMD